jgi:hypothetical protein
MTTVSPAAGGYSSSGHLDQQRIPWLPQLRNRLMEHHWLCHSHHFASRNVCSNTVLAWLTFTGPASVHCRYLCVDAVVECVLHCCQAALLRLQLSRPAGGHLQDTGATHSSTVARLSCSAIITNHGTSGASRCVSPQNSKDEPLMTWPCCPRAQQHCYTLRP